MTTTHIKKSLERRFETLRIANSSRFLNNLIDYVGLVLKTPESRIAIKALANNPLFIKEWTESTATRVRTVYGAWRELFRFYLCSMGEKARKKAFGAFRKTPLSKDFDKTDPNAPYDPVYSMYYYVTGNSLREFLDKNTPSGDPAGFKRKTLHTACERIHNYLLDELEAASNINTAETTKLECGNINIFYSPSSPQPVRATYQENHLRVGKNGLRKADLQVLMELAKNCNKLCSIDKLATLLEESASPETLAPSKAVARTISRLRKTGAKIKNTREIGYTLSG